MALIEVKNVEKIYKDDGAETIALGGITFDISEGEFVAITGASGSGKSTLLHILGFLDKPTKGEYFFDGKTIHQYAEKEIAKLRNKKMGFIFQSFNLLPRMSVLENVKLPLLYSDASENQWNELTLKAIESVSLSHRVYYEPSQLSGGEKQRVAIARALINNPKIIFADEPTGNLDSKTGGQIMEILSSLHLQGRTIILITHETYTAECAQRIIHLKDGRIIKDEKNYAQKQSNFQK